MNKITLIVSTFPLITNLDIQLGLEELNKGDRKVVYIVLKGDNKDNLIPLETRRLILIKGLFPYINLEYNQLVSSIEEAKAYYQGKYEEIEIREIKRDYSPYLEGRDFHFPIQVFLTLVDENLYFAAKARKFYSYARYQHVIRVATLSYNICLNNNLDPCLGMMAGYYHDITRSASSKNQKLRVEEKYRDIFYNNEKFPLWAYHQFSALEVLDRKFHIEDKIVLDAIRCHTTGDKNMSPYAQILYAADKIEPGRKWHSEEFIKMMMTDYKSGFKAVLKANKEFLEEHSDKGSINNKMTLDCFNCYL